MSFAINTNLESEFTDLMSTIDPFMLAIDGMQNLDPFGFRKKFLDSMDNIADNSVDPNANMDDKSPVSLAAEMFKPLQKLDSLNVLWRHIKNRYGDKVAHDAINWMLDGKIYFHDSTKTHIPYCVAASTMRILTDGLPFGARPKPPTRADSYTNQTIEFIMQMAQEVAGAVAVPDYFVNYAWFSKRHEVDEYRVKQDQERLVFTVNNNFRIGGDSPFTNLPIFDKTTFARLFEDVYFPDHTPVIDYWDEVERVQDIFCDWSSKGHLGLPFKFPVVTMNIAADENQNVLHEDHLKKMMVFNKQLCSFNFYVGEKLASCCRLTSDLSKMRDNIRFNSGFGNGGLNIGSHRVVAINLHRIALESTYLNGRGFFERLGEAMDTTAMILETHRNSILKKRIDQGFLRFFRLGWLHLDMFFSTIGMMGLADAVELMAGVSTADPKGNGFAQEILDFMEKKASEYTKKYNAAFNIEECPAEGASAKLAKKDAYLFGQYNNHLPYLLANQCVPLDEDVSIFQRANMMGPLMTMSGGSIAHFNIVDEDPDPDSLFLFAKRIIKDAKIPHFAFNKAIAVCSKDEEHVMYGPHEECIYCGAEIGDIITRVVGYFVPVSKWNKARRQGFQDRKFYHLNGAETDSEAVGCSMPWGLL